MPWTVSKSSECPASKPWAVIREGGEVEGCHETEEAAKAQMRALYASEQGAGELEHKTLKATATATDRGQFSALAATYSVDRVKDRIIPGAFKKTIEQWKLSEKMIPVHWDHSGDAEDIIGYVDPASMEETKDGLYVEGRLDIDKSDVAKEAWRSMKNNAVALSFGYLTVKERKAKDGVNELLEIDLYEVSIVPAPANTQTRLLSLKSALQEGEETEVEEPEQELEQPVEDGGDEEPEKAKSAPQDPLVKEAWDLILRGAFGGSPPKHVPEPEPEPEPEPLDPAKVQREAWALLLKSK